MARMTGTIKQLREKGVGVLAASDGTEYSFDQTAAGEKSDALRAGQSVSFEACHGPKGPRAENVKKF
jgi:cold shock CspA family protein